jgi:NADPH-dependent curcumin reductase CurA
MTKSRQIVLASRPVGRPTSANFRLETVDLPDPADGQVLVRNTWMSVDPYMRGRMYDGPSYVPSFQVDKPLEGGVIGEVVKSRSPALKEGDVVSHFAGWREYALIDGPGAPSAIGGAFKIDTSLAPAQAFLGVLGMPGLTAYAGLLVHGKPKPGETVFVSAASGAVGSIVGQIAKIKGCYVAGSAGSDDKVVYLTKELGFDDAFNYKTDDLDGALRKACPKGVDVYFENVGGPQLQAVLTAMNPFGRIPVCGMIAQYNATTPPAGPNNLITVIPKRLTIRGFIVSDHNDLLPEFIKDVSTWIREGKIKYQETVHEGLDQAPAAFLGLFDGENTGKMLVKLA